METVTRNISDISISDRRALEDVIGHSLNETQRIVIQVLDSGVDKSEDSHLSASGETLPAWCNVYDGLTDE